MSSMSIPDQTLTVSSPAQRTRSLASRLTLWYGLSAFLLIAGPTGFMYWVLVANLDREDHEFLWEDTHSAHDFAPAAPQYARAERRGGMGAIRAPVRTSLPGDHE